ncbi:hypothetical protein ABEB36_009729 [Hypothenemus hampei]|uniref:FGF n=1 Tax=Hypothenemus hampei TaxID=57062 RepID=A0ABD1EH98_HYPHA
MSTCRNYLMQSSDSSSSDDDAEDLSPDEQDTPNSTNPGSSREKRSVTWCGVNDRSKPQLHLFPMVRRVVWPPPTTSQPALRNAYVDPRSFAQGNPKLGNRMQLYSRTGFFLAVYPDGKVRGTRDDSDQHTFLERKTGGLLPEHVKFQGIISKFYVAMDKKGRLYGETDANSSATIFIESLHGMYNNYLSRNYAHLGWYLGLKKSGKFKKGSKTKFGQKAVKFLPTRTKFE